MTCITRQCVFNNSGKVWVLKGELFCREQHLVSKLRDGFHRALSYVRSGWNCFILVQPQNQWETKTLDDFMQEVNTTTHWSRCVYLKVWFLLFLVWSNLPPLAHCIRPIVVQNMMNKKPAFWCVMFNFILFLLTNLWPISLLTNNNSYQFFHLVLNHL